MEKIIRLLPWMLLCVSSTLIVIIVSNQNIGLNQLSAWIKNPLIIALVVSSFVFLTVDRLKDMTSRIGKIEDRTSSFWNDAIKEIQAVASNHAKITVQNLTKEVEEKINEIHLEIEKTISDNPWLSSINPEELVLSTNHLQPIHRKAAKMLDNDKEGKNTEIVRKWILDTIKNPKVTGTANDYHNLGVMASRDLDDKLLSIEICESYLEKNNVANPNPDILSDLLQDLTDVENFERAKQIADKILMELENKNTYFTYRWRPWVFLSDYYYAIGNNKQALNILIEAKKHVVTDYNKAHVLTNLASCYKNLGDNNTAIQIYKETIEQFPSHTPCTLLLAKTYVNSDKFEDALTVIKQGLKFVGQDTRFNSYYANLIKLNSDLQKNGGMDDKKEAFTDAANIILTLVKDEVSEEKFESILTKVKSKMKDIYS